MPAIPTPAASERQARRARAARRSLLWNVFVALLLAGLTALAFAAPRPPGRLAPPLHNGSAHTDVAADGGGGGGTGGSTFYVPTNTYPTIQSAINASSSGDTVNVAAGTYTGAGNVDLDFGGRNITLQGAGAGFTIIDCGSGTNGNRRGFYFHSGETSSAVVQGVTVENGYTGDPSTALAGAVLIEGSNPTFRACAFQNNRSIGTYGSNSAYGGAIAVLADGSGVTAINCIFTGNVASATNQSLGGVVYAQDNSAVTLTNCLFTGNSASGSGFEDYGGVLAVGSGPTVTLTHCTLTGNSVGGATYDTGSAIIALSSTQLTITNCILYGDAGSSIGEIYAQNTPITVTYSDVQDGDGSGADPYPGTGNIDANPQFVSGTAPYDLHLKTISPCIGAGTASTGPATDYDGRAYHNLPSMGAYENYTEYVPSQQYPTIQSAINASFSGDTVQVAGNTYTGPGNVDLDFGGRNITLQGAGASSTLIDCEGSSAANHRGFIFQSGETSSALVQGFTVQNGYESGNNISGGAVEIDNGSQPTLRDCVFQNNQVVGTGSNSAAFGGAVAVVNTNSGVTLVNCLLTNNALAATGSGYEAYGGALFAYTAAAITLTNCTFSGNSVSSANFSVGSAVLLLNDSQGTVTNCILYGNTGSSYGQLYAQGTPTSVTYSDVQGGYGGTGNFNAAPLFVGNGDYHLMAGSPCIDAGTASGAPAKDLNGNTRDALPDIGAYEFNGHAQLTLTGVNINPTVQQSFTGTVATLSDTNPNAPASDFTATINWGDNTTPTAGTVTANGNDPTTAASQFNISGTHTYALPGQYTVTTTVTEQTFGTQAQAQSTATVGVISTSTNLSSSLNPSVSGQSVMFTATVTTTTGGTAVTEGSVDFVDTTTNTDLGTMTVNATTGQASVNTSALAVGSHSITATYSDTGGVYGGSSDTLTQTVNNPVPTIVKQVTDPIPAGSPGFSLLIRGTGFVPASKIAFDGQPRQTTYVSPTQLRTFVQAIELTAAHQVPVTVTNPAPGGGTSNTGYLLVTPTGLKVTAGTVTSDGNGGYRVPVTVTNIGYATAQFAHILSASLGGASTTTPLPVKLGTLTPGQSATVTLAFPSSAGTSGQTVTLLVRRTYRGDPYQFQASQSVTLL